MKVQLVLLVLTAVLIVTLGCGGPKKDTGASPTATPQEDTSAPKAEEVASMTLIGTLGKTVEAGGWILKTSDKTYLLLTITQYRTQDWFKEGARLKVTGKESPDTVSIFMQGIPFKVSSMEPE
jgi:hypothetical protein